MLTASTRDISNLSVVGKFLYDLINFIGPVDFSFNEFVTFDIFSKNSNVWFTNFLISDFLSLISKQFNVNSFYGFNDTVFSHNFISPDTNNQIISVIDINNNHFLCVKLCYTRFDSVSYPTIIIADSIMDISDQYVLKIFQKVRSSFSTLPANKFLIKILQTQQQENSCDCGPYSIINSLIFALDFCPSNIYLYESSLRPFLGLCYDNSKIVFNNFFKNIITRPKSTLLFLSVSQNITQQPPKKVGKYNFNEQDILEVARIRNISIESAKKYLRREAIKNQENITQKNIRLEKQRQQKVKDRDSLSFDTLRKKSVNNAVSKKKVFDNKKLFSNCFKIAFLDINNIDFNLEYNLSVVSFNLTPCKFCSAFLLPSEPKGMCCLSGKIVLPLFKDPTDEVKALYLNYDKFGKTFHKFSRLINNSFAYSSWTHKQIDNSKPSIKIHGLAYQVLGPL